MRYTPDSPLSAGVEWPASRQRDDPISSSLGRGALFEVATSQSFNTVKTFMRTNGGQVFVGPNARYGVDIYNPDDMSHGAIQRAYSVPDADRSSTGLWVNHLGAGSPLWSDVDDWPTLLTADDLTLQYGYATGGHGRVLFSASTTWRDMITNAIVDLSAQRILGVQVDCIVQCSWPSGSYTVQGLLEVGGYIMPGSVVGVTFTGSQTPRTSAVIRQIGFKFGAAGWRNYESMRPSDLDDFEASGGFGIDVHKHPTDTVGSLQLLAIRCNVDYVTEKRLATGWVSDPVGHEGWVSFPLTNPSTGVATSVTKTAGQRVLAVVRSDYLTAGNTWRSLDCANTTDHDLDSIDGYGGVDVPFANTVDYWSGGLPGIVSYPQVDTSTHAPAMYLLQSGTVRVDTSPYVRVTSDPLTTAGPIGQKFVPAATAVFGEVRFQVLNSAEAHAAGNVTVEIRRSSDNAVMGGGATWVPSTDLPEVDDRHYVARARLATAPTLTNGTSYYVRLAIASGTIRVTLLSCDATEPGPATFGSTTQVAFDPGSPLPTGIADGDFANMLANQVPAILAGSNLSEDTMLTTAHDICAVGEVPYALLDWTTTAHGAIFEGYEVQRNEDSAGWVAVADIRDEAHSSFADVEAQRGVTVSYRARVRWTNGAVGDWRTFGFGIVVSALPDPWAVFLGSNVRPFDSVALLDEPGYEWLPREPDRIREVMLYGEDLPLVFRERERRGETFTRNLVIAFNEFTEGSAASGRKAFDSLEDLVHDPDLPYICVTDGRSRRWFTAPVIEAIRENEPGGQYLAQVLFRQVRGPALAIIE